MAAILITDYYSFSQTIWGDASEAKPLSCIIYFFLRSVFIILIVFVCTSPNMWPQSPEMSNPLELELQLCVSRLTRALGVNEPSLQSTLSRLYT